MLPTTEINQVLARQATQENIQLMLENFKELNPREEDMKKYLRYMREITYAKGTKLIFEHD